MVVQLAGRNQLRPYLTKGWTEKKRIFRIGDLEEIIIRDCIVFRAK
jgi:hypothetical protein